MMTMGQFIDLMPPGARETLVSVMCFADDNIGDFFRSLDDAESDEPLSDSARALVAQTIKLMTYAMATIAIEESRTELIIRELKRRGREKIGNGASDAVPEKS